MLGVYLHAWCKSMGSKLKKLMFPYDLLDSYKKLRNVGRVCYEDLYSNRKTTIAKDERNRTGMIAQQWVRVCNVADIVSFFEALKKMAEQHYPEKIDVCKDGVCIPSSSTVCTEQV